MIVQWWQIVAILVIAFLFGWRIGWVHGEGHAWGKMDEREKEGEVETDDDIQRRAW